MTYQWLDYKLRAVTAVRADDQVLSGPFSGCFLVVFKKPDNLTYVAHIGTGGSEVTTAVKKTWTEFASDPKAPPKLLGAFNPARAYFGVSLIPPTKPKDLKKHQESVDRGFADLGELAKKGAKGPEVQDVGSVIYAVVTPKPAVPECHTVLLRQQKKGPVTVPLFRVIGIFPSIPVADPAKNPLFK